MPITHAQIQSAQRLQHNAAHDGSPQVRLIAGPGTGKSFAIEERVLWLLHRGLTAARIFVISFTRASARDLKKRIERYCTSRGITTASSVSVTTLHSLALRTLRAAGLLTYPSDPMVMDTWELKEIFDAEFSNSSGIRAPRCESIRLANEAFWSTGQWGPANYVPPNPPITPNELSAFRNFHAPRTQTYSCVLPGEIVRQCVSNMAHGILDPVALLRIENLIVDEFQDLNPCDLEFIDYLIQRGVVTFVAGDDDQSIYSFRFASPQGIQQFTNRYPSASDHRVADCFRCTPSIVQSATSLINSYPVPNRIPKTLTSLYAVATPPLQGIVECWQFQTGVLEAQAIAESCRDLIQAGMPPREILLLLSNTRILSRDLVNALNVLQIPHERPKADAYIDLPAGRLALTILRIICKQDDYIAHRTLLGMIPGVGIRTCNSIADKVISNNLSFVNLFYLPLPAAIFSTRESNAITGVQNITSQLIALQSTDTLSQRGTVIQNILGTIQGTASQQAWALATGHLPQDISLEEVKDYLWADTDEQESAILESVYQRLQLPFPNQGVLPQRVRIMTMHGVKGLSARIVFIPGLEEDIFPGQWRIPYPGLVFEAARLLYVSISRARAACVLSFSRSRIVYGRANRQNPSRFTSFLGCTFTFNYGGGLSAHQVSKIMAECSQL